MRLLRSAVTGRFGVRSGSHSGPFPGVLPLIDVRRVLREANEYMVDLSNIQSPVRSVQHYLCAPWVTRELKMDAPVGVVPRTPRQWRLDDAENDVRGIDRLARSEALTGGCITGGKHQSAALVFLQDALGASVREWRDHRARVLTD